MDQIKDLLSSIASLVESGKMSSSAIEIIKRDLTRLKIISERSIKPKLYKNKFFKKGFSLYEYPSAISIIFFKGTLNEETRKIVDDAINLISKTNGLSITILSTDQSVTGITPDFPIAKLVEAMTGNDGITIKAKASSLTSYPEIFPLFDELLKFEDKKILK